MGESKVNTGASDALAPLKKVMSGLDGKKILILGYGREGKATLERVTEFVKDASVTVADMKVQSLPEGVCGLFGEGYQDTLNDYDVIIKSPGIVLKDKSPDILKKVTSQTELFLAAYRDRTIGITGTKGKSTTTSLIWHVLKNVNPDTLLMGNIGIAAFLQLEKIGPGTKFVYELSCHQLEYTRVSPNIAVLLNLFEEHLDHYGTKEAYFDAKRNIACFQKPGDIFFCNVLQKDDVPECVGKLITMTQTFSDKEKTADLTVSGRNVIFDGNSLFLPAGCTSLAGEHNLYNIGAAYGVCRTLGVSDGEFMKALSDFVPLPHRLERIGVYEGVTYYDDSISTACETAIGAMKALKEEGVGSVLLGGMDRGIDYTPLADYLISAPENNPEYVILMPDSGARIGGLLKEKGFSEKRIIETGGLLEAVEKAKELTPKGKVCLLSPAAASYGFFKNFEDRGDKFKAYVKGE